MDEKITCDDVLEYQVSILKTNDKLSEDEMNLLEKIAGFSKDKAKDLVMKKVEEMMNREISSYISS